MKKIMIFIFTCILIATQAGYAQNFKPLSIPSFEIPVSGQSVFQENKPSDDNNTDGKRKIYVKVSSQRCADSLPCEATVWAYSLDLTTLYGPFIVSCGETLEVEIDEREWGVLVESDYTVYVDVWTSVFDD